MSDRPLPRLVGSLLLTRLIDQDSLGEIIRARRVDVSQGATFELVRRFSAAGIETAKLAEAAKLAAPVLQGLKGPSIAKGSWSFEADGSMYLASEYVPGHSLAKVLVRTTDEQFPVAVDQSLLIVDKVVSALDTAHQFRVDDARVQHRFVVPSFVWITEDGEVKLGGFGFGPALLAMAKSGPLAEASSRYIAPECREGGKPSKSVDVYASCAILFELLTGTKVPADVSAQVLSVAEVAHDAAPLPDDIAQLLRRGLSSDPAGRHESISDLRKELSKILFSGNYAPTTFNLAFFMNNLFRGEMEKEAKERAQEETLKAEDFKPKPVAPPPPPKPAAPSPVVPGAGAPSSAAPSASAPPPAPRATIRAESTPTFAAASEPPKSKMGLFIAVGAAALLGVGVGIFFMLRKEQTKPIPTIPEAALAPPQTSLSAAATAMDPAAFEEAVNRRVKEKIAELETAKQAEQDPKKKKEQEKLLAQLKVQESEAIKKQEVAQKATQAAAVEEKKTGGAGAGPGGGATPASPSAEELAKKQKEAQEAAKKLEATLAASSPPVTTSNPAPAPPPSVPPAVVASAPLNQPPAAGTVSSVKEGDLVDINEVDDAPLPQIRLKPEYPRVALMRKSQGTVILSILVDEKGRVADVKVLRKANDDLLNDAALKAARDWTYRPATKQGKKVRTWVTDTVPFKL